MAISYHYYKNPSGEEDPGKTPRIHPRVVKAKKYTLAKICRTANEMSTFTAGEAEGLLKLVSKIIIGQLKMGNNVQWDEFGTFSLSLEADPTTDPKELTPGSIRVKTIHFRPCRELKKELKYFELERAKGEKELALPAVWREENIMTYIRKKGTIHASICMAINKCSRTTAYRDLKKLEKKGMLNSSAPVSSSTTYVLPEK